MIRSPDNVTIETVDIRRKLLAQKKKCKEKLGKIKTKFRWAKHKRRPHRAEGERSGVVFISLMKIVMRLGLCLHITTHVQQHTLIPICNAQNSGMNRKQKKKDIIR